MLNSLGHVVNEERRRTCENLKDYKNWKQKDLKNVNINTRANTRSLKESLLSRSC